MLKTLVSIFNKISNYTSPSSIPCGDTLDLVPIVAVTEQSLLTKDGAFIQMFEVPPIEIDIEGKRLAALQAGWHQALSKLPLEMKLQISTFIVPRDPTKELDYFIKAERHWGFLANKAGNDISKDRFHRQYSALQEAANAVAAQLIVNYDQKSSTTWRFLLTISFQVEHKGSKIGPKSNLRERVDAWLIQAEQAQKALKETGAFFYRTFSKNNIPLIALSPAEMCQVVWRGLHPETTGAIGSSAVDISDSMVGKFSNPKRTPPDQSSFYSGISTEALADLLAPEKVYEEASAMTVDDAHLAGYVIYDFEPNKPVLLDQLLNLPGGSITSIYLEVFDPTTYSQSVKQGEVQIRASMDAEAPKGVIEYMSDRPEIGAVQNANYDLEITGKLQFFMRFYLIRTALSEEILEKRCLSLESYLKTQSVKFFRAKYSQMLLWKSTYPTGNFVLPQKPRNMTAESLSAFWPPIGRLIDSEGIYLGVDQETQDSVIVDPFGVHNDRDPSFLVLGKSGAGKSVYFRTLMVSALLTGAKVFVLDIDGEFEKLTQHYGGKYIRIGANEGDRLNILDIPPNSKDAYTAAVEQLIAFFSLLSGEKILPGRERSTLEDALRIVLKDRGWLKEDEAGETYATNWSSRDAPRLSDLARALKHFQVEGETLADLAKPYSDGIIAPYFNAATTVDFSKENFVVFNLAATNEATDELGQKLYLLQIMGVIGNEILHSYNMDPYRRHYVFLDELWAILGVPGGGDYIRNFMRRLRMRHGAIWMTTHQLGRFLDDKDGKRIISKAGYVMLLNQRPHQAKLIQRVAGLSEYITCNSTKLRTGNGILLLPNNSIHLSFNVNPTGDDAAVPTSWQTNPD